VTTVEVTWTRAVKVFWSLLWRSALWWALIGVAVAGPVWFFSLPPAGAPDPDATFRLTPDTLPFVAIGTIVGVFIEVWIVKTVMGQAYSDFRIVLEGPPKRLKIEPRL
jgi:hypothetical protein